MEFREWEPEYRNILGTFGFTRAEDEAAAEELRRLLPTAKHPLLGTLAEDALRRRLQGKDVVLVGRGPGLLPLPLPSPWLEAGDRAVVSADGATSACLAHGTVPQVIVTDLDGRLPDEVEANLRGALVLVHAHGDNRAAMREWVPWFPRAVAGSCAAAPGRGLLNPGGFTDGDRGVFLCEEFGARSILLVGFDFANPREEPEGTLEVKRRKLGVARRLIEQVAARGRTRILVLTPEMKVHPFAAPGARGSG